MKTRIIIFAPHPDDETLACGGTIAESLRLGHEVYIVFMTDGRNSHLHELRITSNPTPSELKVIRNREAKNAAKVLGMKEENLIFLDFEDGTLNASLKSAEEKVKQILQRVKPDEVYFPSVKDGHHDHHSANIIVQKSLKALRLQPKAYEYVIWLDNQNLAKINHQVSVDISDVRLIKRRAIAEYKSQITNFSSKQKRPILTSAFLDKFLSDSEIFTT